MGRCNFSLVCLVFICSAVLGKYAEAQKTVVNPCGQKLPCDDQLQCIERGQWCDRNYHCDDGSDEYHCRIKGSWDIFNPSNNCDDRHFVCQNKQCVPSAARCDEFIDCKDGSDENECESTVEGSSSEVDRESPNPYGSEEDAIDSRDSGEEDRQEIVNTTTTSTVTDELHPKIPNLKSPVQGHRPREATATEYYQKRMLEAERPENGYRQVPVRWSHHGSQNREPQDYLPTSGPSHGSRDSAPRLTSSSASPSQHRRRTVVPYPPEQPRGIIQTGTRHGERSPPARRRKHPLPSLTPFRFEENLPTYRRQVQKAKDWLLDQRGDSGGWGDDTPRALVALSLADDGPLSNLHDYDLVRRRLRLDLGAKLLKRESPSSAAQESLSDSRLAMYINALLATCQEPRRIFDLDLVELLHNMTRDRRLRGLQANPFVFITLCVTNSSLTPQDFGYFLSVFNTSVTDEVTKDRYILASTALACFLQYEEYRSELHSYWQNIFKYILQFQHEDGSFGTVYSTALAAQALAAMDLKKRDRKKTLDYLSNQQLDDGSFGDMLATYYALPALSGRSLVHLRNTECEKTNDTEASSSEEKEEEEPWGPMKTVRFTIAVGSPKTASLALQLSVPVHKNFFEIMRIAERTDSRFKFSYTEHSGKIEVYSISNIPNNPERGTFWFLYVSDAYGAPNLRQFYNGDIKTLIPEDNQELTYWYLPSAKVLQPISRY